VTLRIPQVSLAAECAFQGVATNKPCNRSLAQSNPPALASFSVYVSAAGYNNEAGRDVRNGGRTGVLARDCGINFRVERVLGPLIDQR
jgi:hypothetical protein